MKRFCSKERRTLSPVFSLALFAAAVLLLLRGAGSVASAAEQAVRRAAVQCYAVEGIYPPDLGYMRDHYGLQVDEERYLVDYRCFASNLMPDITVLPR